jgi:outer membrane biosynthesis protein TonB
MKLLFLLLLALTVANGCARAHAKTTPESPPLDMPASPAREVEPSDAEAPPPVPLPEEPARSAVPRARPTTPREQPRAEAPKPEPPKTEPAPAEPPKPEEPTRPPTMLQTTPTTAEGEIRAILSRASTDLNRVDASRLSADARTQYDAAKSFIRQADAAVRAKNLVFAKNLAEKAQVLAAQLAPK